MVKKIGGRDNGQHTLGFCKLSGGYIAEVERKCGLEMRDNYNIAKKNAPKKLCTKEKEAYIKEALRHFGMI